MGDLLGIVVLGFVVLWGVGLVLAGLGKGVEVAGNVSRRMARDAEREQQVRDYVRARFESDADDLDD